MSEEWMNEEEELRLFNARSSYSYPLAEHGIRAMVRRLEAKLKLYEGGEYEAQVKMLTAELAEIKKHQGFNEYADLIEKANRVGGLELSLKSCQEALAAMTKDRDLWKAQSAFESEHREKYRSALAAMTKGRDTFKAQWEHSARARQGLTSMLAEKEEALAKSEAKLAEAEMLRGTMQTAAELESARADKAEAQVKALTAKNKELREAIERVLPHMKLEPPPKLGGAHWPSLIKFLEKALSPSPDKEPSK